MKNKLLLSAPVVALMITACGGGGSEETPNSTASDTEVRFTMTPEAATGLVKSVNIVASHMAQVTRYFGLFSPAVSNTENTARKEVGFASCTFLSRDPNYTGRVRVETDFPINRPQTSFRDNSKITFTWENISGEDFGRSLPINSVETLTFHGDFPSTPPFTGSFTSNFKRTTPEQVTTNVTYKLNELLATVDTTSRRGSFTGSVTVNSFLGRPADFDETLVFNNWSNFVNVQAADATVQVSSKRLINPFPTSFTRTARAQISIISSSPDRTEYRVVASASGIADEVTRTVIVTLDDQGNLVFTAS